MIQHNTTFSPLVFDAVNALLNMPRMFPKNNSLHPNVYVFEDEVQ